MKKFSLLLLVAFVLFAFVACAPQLRFKNDTGGDYNYDKFEITFDGAVYDVKDLKDGEATPYKFVKAGTKHTCKYVVSYMNMEITYEFSEQDMEEEGLNKDLKNGKKYTASLEGNGITED